MRRFAFCFPLLALFAAAAAAEDPVAIKVAYPQAGQRAKVTVEGKTVTKSVFTVQGNAQTKEDVKTKSLVYTDEVIENPKNEKRATKLKRTYEKAAVGKGGDAKTLPVEGKTVLIEKKGDKYAFTVDGEALTGESLKLLEDEFGKKDGPEPRELMLPKTPVKPGDTWKVDPGEIAKAFGPTGPMLAKDEVKAGGTLVKAYKKDGRQFGVIELVFEAPVTGLGEKSPLAVKDGKMTLKITGDGCIDGTAPTGTSTGKLVFAVTGTAMGIDLKMLVEETESRTTELLPAK
jgi:hypothetical protein